MKKILLSGVCCCVWGLSGQAQLIFEKNGLYGLQYEGESPILPAKYAGIANLKSIYSPVYILAKPAPASVPDGKPFDGLESLDNVLITNELNFNYREWTGKANYLYGFVGFDLPQNKPSDCAYSHFAFSDGLEPVHILARYPDNLLDVWVENPEAGFIKISAREWTDLTLRQGSLNEFVATDNRDKSGVIRLEWQKIITVIPVHYNTIQQFSNDDAALYLAELGGKWSAFDQHGKKILPSEYTICQHLSNISGDGREYLAMQPVVKKGKTSGTGLFRYDYQRLENVLPTDFERIETGTYLTRPCAIVVKGGKMGFYQNLDETLALTIPIEYDSIRIINEKYILAYQAGQARVWYGDEMVKNAPSLDELTPLATLFSEISDEYLYQFRHKGKYGILNMQNLAILYPAELDSIQYQDGKLLLMQQNKRGLYDWQKRMTWLRPQYEAFSAISVRHSDGGGQDTLFLVQQNGLSGIVFPISEQEILPTQYNSINLYSLANPLFITEKNGFFGISNMRGNAILPTEYNSIEIPNKGRFAILQKDDIFNVWDLQMNRLVEKASQFQAITPNNEYTWSIRKGGRLGTMTVGTWAIDYLEPIAKKFPLKWRTRIGITTFRTNIQATGAAIAIGSNGISRDTLTNDTLDGIYILNPKDGKIQKHLRTARTLDDDINGIAIDGTTLYTGGDNGILAAYKLDGSKLWEQPLGAEIENSPVLADVNGDKIPDAIVATESPARIWALNGKTGAILWKYEASQGGYFVATPATYDLNGDQVSDIVVGTGGNPYCYAINGKTGAELWRFKTKSTAGFVDGSGVHASATILLDKNNLPTVVVSECYGLVHYLDANGKLLRSENTELGVFSSPTFSTNGAFAVGISTERGGLVEIVGTTWHKTYATFANARVSASAAVADLLQQNAPQFIIPDEAGQLLIVHSLTNEVLGRYALPAGAEASPFVADIDKDGKLELLVACLDGYLYCYKTDAPSAGVVWGQFRGNNRNTGVIRLK